MKTDTVSPTAAPTAQPSDDVPDARAGAMAVRDRRASQQLERASQPVGADTSPPAVIARMLNSGMALADMKGMLELQERWEANEARKAFVTAMANFKANPPTIEKDKSVGYTNKDGTFTGYKHASIGNVVGKIVAGLAREGFSHRWTVDQADQITVTCFITHERGHSESVTMKAGRDDSGKKNPIQQVASTITYLQRYTLLAATGLATNDQADDDGGGGGEPERATLTEAQQKELRAECEALGPAVLGKLLGEYKVTSLADIPESEYQSCKTLLANTRKRRQEKAAAAGATT